jgi:hypothetical protein
MSEMPMCLLRIVYTELQIRIMRKEMSAFSPARVLADFAPLQIMKMEKQISAFSYMIPYFQHLETCYK